ncbi:MAG TPA: flagella basal body P-ring formation protein FlgA [Bryobacteraceae bacterium]|nr:flagella basal body P-ring formation protein FlgA [Bryobacteraceae bacterium]
MNGTCALLFFLALSVALASDSAEDDAGAASPSILQSSAPSQTIPPKTRVSPPAVLRGDKVQVTVWSGAVLLRFDAQAESTARPGETVIVRNPENGRRFVARVEEKGKVFVKK